MEGKRNDTGMRFVLQQAVESNQGGLLWGEDHFPALIDWKDVVVAYGLRQGIKYAQLVRRQASSPRARGADGEGNRYFVQVIVEGTPYQKAKNLPGTDTTELDIGPSTLAVVPREGGSSPGRVLSGTAPSYRQEAQVATQDAAPPTRATLCGRDRPEALGLAQEPRFLRGGDSECSMMTAYQVCLSLHRFL